MGKIYKVLIVFEIEEQFEKLVRKWYYLNEAEAKKAKRRFDRMIRKMQLDPFISCIVTTESLQDGEEKEESKKA